MSRYGAFCFSQSRLLCWHISQEPARTEYSPLQVPQQLPEQFRQALSAVLPRSWEQRSDSGKVIPAELLRAAPSAFCLTGRDSYLPDRLPFYRRPDTLSLRFPASMLLHQEYLPGTGHGSTWNRCTSEIRSAALCPASPSRTQPAFPTPAGEIPDPPSLFLYLQHRTQPAYDDEWQHFYRCGYSRA